MKIIVCIKQVPDTNNVRIDPKTGTLIREGVPSIINPADRTAIEEALKLGGKVTILSMGPPQAEDAIREAIAMGADDGILLSDRLFGGSDTIATSYALSCAIRKIKDYDLILAGKQAIDGDTGQIGPQLAELLDLPQITYARKIEIKNNKAVAERQLEHGYEIIESNLPLLVTVIKEANKPRHVGLNGIMKSFEASIKVWGAKDIEADENKIGFKGSPTWVSKTFIPSGKGQGTMLEGSKEEKVKQLVNILKRKMV